MPVACFLVLLCLVQRRKWLEYSLSSNLDKPEPKNELKGVLDYWSNGWLEPNSINATSRISANRRTIQHANTPAWSIEHLIFFHLWVKK